MDKERLEERTVVPRRSPAMKHHVLYYHRFQSVSIQISQCESKLLDLRPPPTDKIIDRLASTSPLVLDVRPCSLFYVGVIALVMYVCLLLEER